jgi:ribosomal-protein-alanine N-acetyltransferase
MLRMVTFPPDEEKVRRWFREHRREWAEAVAYRFAILHQGKMIGLVDIDSVTGSEGVLGYWLEQSAWGCGFAFEAATAAVHFALRGVLQKLGFQLLDDVPRFSHSRREDIVQLRYILTSCAESR